MKLKINTHSCFGLHKILDQKEIMNLFPFLGLLTTLIILILSPLSLEAQIAIPISHIDSVFADIDQPQKPGCALVIISGGELVYNRGYGNANLDYDIPIDSNTIMNIGSVSKQFVAAAILNASLQGYLSINDDLRKWIPEFPDYGYTITIRHLIYHTSGIRDEAQLRAVGNLPDDITREETIKLLTRQQALNFKPGEHYLYSNGGYLLLIEILERATSKTIQEYLSQEFFQPLGINSAYYGQYDRPIPHASSSYAPSNEGFRRVSHVGDVIGVSINSLDLGRWMMALNNDKLGPKGFLDLQLEKGVLNNGDTIHYAYGLDLMEHRGIPVIRHGGAGSGYRTGMAIYPDEDLLLCALCNQSNIDAVARIWKVAEILLEDQMDSIKAADSGGGYPIYWPAPSGEAIQLSSDQLVDLDGYYFAPELNVVFQVLVEGEGIRVGPEGWMRPMVSTSKVDQFTDGRGWAQIKFERNNNGIITVFTMDIGRVNGLIMKRLSIEELPNIKQD